MPAEIKLEEKYERNGWPSIKRPDLKPPEGWSLELLVGVNRIRNHRLSPDGKKIAFIWDRGDLSEVYVMPAAGGWPRRISMKRAPVAYWDDEFRNGRLTVSWLAFTMEGSAYLVEWKEAYPGRSAISLNRPRSPAGCRIARACWSTSTAAGKRSSCC